MSASLGSFVRAGLVVLGLGAAACHKRPPPVVAQPSDPTCRVHYPEVEAKRRATVAFRLQAVRRDVSSCFERFRLSGYALTCVDVSAEGVVDDVAVEGALHGTDEAHCIEAAVGAIKFPVTGAPWSFDYPYVFK